MSRFSGKHFDQLLYLSQGEAQYRENKSKAGAVGGSVSSPTKEHMNALTLYRINSKKELFCLALKDLEHYEKGKKYALIVDKGAKILSPYPVQLKNWDEFVTYFKRFKRK